MPRRTEPVLEGPVEHGADGQDDEQAEVAEHAEAQRQAPTVLLHIVSGTSKRRRAQPMPSNTSSEISTSTMETAPGRGRSSLWERLKIHEEATSVLNGMLPEMSTTEPNSPTARAKAS